MRKLVTTGLAIALLCFVPCNAVFAQVNSAIGGTVDDASHALIPGVTIKAVNTQTAVETITITNESGVYNFPALVPGTYKVTAELPGFRPHTFNDVQLSAGSPVRLNFTLQVGGVSQSVDVSVASDTLLRESSASIGEVLPESKVGALPIVGNNVLDLVRILPGYRESTAGNAFDTFAGAAANTLNTVRDGISVSDGRFNNGLFATTTINPDLVGEVRLILTPVDAEMGRGNAQVQITTRSGTNRYAGSATWSVRNTKLDPNTWANNRQVDPITGKAVQPDWTNDNDYTISYGGPIIRNKTFFFALWDQRIRRERQTVNGVVLTDTARLGIFRFYDGWNPGNADATETATPTTSVTRIARAVDLLGNPVAPKFNATGTPYAGTGLQCLSVFGTQRLDSNGAMVPFTGNDCPGGTAIFPTGGATTWDTNRSIFDPTGIVWAGALRDMPHANWFGANGTTDGLNTATIRWLRTTKTAGDTFGTSPNDNRKQLNVKIDHNFNASHKIAGSYTLERNSASSDLSNWPNGISGDVIRRPHIVSLNFTSTLGPTIVNEARFGFRGNYNKVRRPFETEEGAGLLDFVNSIKGGPDPGYTRNPGATYPLQVEITGGALTNYSFGQTNALYNRLAQHNGNTTRQFTYGDTLSWTRSQHAFKFGGEFRPQDSRGYTNLGTNPFPRLSTGAGAVLSPLRSGGSSILGTATSLQTARNNAANLAYLLAGSVNLVTQAYWIDSFTDIQDAKWQSIVTSPDVFRTIKTNEFSSFVKDDWKIKKNLTLNLGVRWEYYGAAYIGEGFTTTPKDQGLGVYGVSRGSSGGVFDSWLVPGANPVFLSGYGNVPAASALQCTQGVAQANLPTSSCNPANLTELEFVGPGSPHPERSAAPPDWNNFGPAVGFAYQVPEFIPFFGQKSTLRGGYSITYSPTRNLSTVQGGAQDMFGSAPGATSILSSAAQLSAQVPGYLDLRDIGRIVPMAPVSPVLPGGSLPIYTRTGARVYGFAPDFATPYVQNFNLSLATNVRRNMTVDLRYVGTQSKKQASDINLNLNNIYYNQEFFDALDQARRGSDPLLLTQMLAGLTLGAGSTGVVGNRVGGVLLTGATALRQSTTYNENLRDGNFQAIAASLVSPATPTGYVTSQVTSDGRLIRNGCDRIATLGSPNYVSPTGDVTPLRCFPENYLVANPQLQVSSATTGAFYRTNAGSTNYHSMEAQFTLRPTQGFSVQSTYTWSKTLGLPGTGVANPLNRRADYARPFSSLTHDWRTNGVIELPMGPNKLFFGNSSGWLARVLERWQAGVILNFSSGTPTSVTALGGLTYGTTVPNVVGPFDRRTGHAQWDGVSNRGTYFGDPNPYISVEDPQCAMSQSWANTLAAIPDCNLRAVAQEVPAGTPGSVVDGTGRTIQYLLVNPAPGKQGNLGLTTVETLGPIKFDANLSKTFRISESKSLQIRIDATNVLNHPTPPAPVLDINDDNFGYLIGDKTGGRSFQGRLRFSF